MPYLDKCRQREANKEAMRRYRAKEKGITLSNGKGITEDDISDTRIEAPVIPRRGRDITKFEHLPSDVQASIDRMCIGLDGTVDERLRRTAIAINYQHQFPGRFHSTGI